MKEEFKVGDVVVCVDDRPRRHSGPSVSQVRKGSHYRVLSVNHSPFLGHPTLMLDGIYSATGRGFYADRFRKIDADVTEDFRKILRKLPEKVQA